MSLKQPLMTRCVDSFQIMMNVEEFILINQKTGILEN
jgi:hypothetical protein